MGLEDVYFSIGISKNATDFLVTKLALLRYIGTQSYGGAATALQVLEQMEAPVFNKPVWPTIVKFEEGLGDSEEEMLVLDYQLTVSEYIENNKAYLAYKKE